MPGIPNYSAARSGLLGDTGAVDASAQINQFLGAHGITPIYAGAQILTQNGAGVGSTDPASFWSCHLDGTDYDQPFTMSGTKIGRITVPVLPVGAGADLVVSLCPDSSGSPGTPVVTVRIPASWITQLSAVAGTAGPSSQLQLTAPTSVPLATPQFNALMPSNGYSFNWTPPAPTSAGAITNPVTIATGNYLVLAAGIVSNGPASNVYTVPWQGGEVLASAVAQPSLPEPFVLTTLMANPTTLIVAGGTNTTSGSVLLSSVYTAGWNPSTGQISAWSQQTPLPQALAGAFGAATATAVYVVGGQNSGPTLLNTVYWATISNGQISSWNTGPPLPIAVKGSFVTIIGNYLVVAGGDSNVGLTAVSNAVYYAVINADGSLGSWQTGPAMPYGVGNTNTGSLATTNTNGFTIVGGYNGSGYSTEIQSLSWGPDGPGVWSLAINAASAETAAFPLGTGQWQFFSLFSSFYDTATLYQVPMMSVPLPVTGLTNGGTYHVTLRQAGGDLNDYLRMPLQTTVFPGSPTVLSRTSAGGSGWTAGTSGYAIPIGIYDQTASGQLLHTWQDGGAQINTIVYATTPLNTFLGVAEATAMPGPVLNANYTFTTGTAPWTAAGGTLAQSSAHTHGNLPFSGLLTPSGSAATSDIESELVPVLQGHNYVATAWLYSGPGYASCKVNINWYSSLSVLLSTTTGTVTALAAGTWTQLSTTSTTAVPAGAYYATAVVAETGTPPSSATLWVSSPTLQDTSGPPLASVTQVTYSSQPPTTPWAPTGTIQLA